MERIDYKQTIARKKIVLEDRWLDRLDRFSFFLMMIYKKIHEEQLLRITTNLSRTEARQLVRQRLNTREWKLERDNKDFLQAVTPFNFMPRKQVTVLFEDGAVYLNVMQCSARLRVPVLFSDRAIRNDLEKWLRQHQHAGDLRPTS